MSTKITRAFGNTSIRCKQCGMHPARCKCELAAPSGSASFDGYAMYPHDISLLLDRLGAEFPYEMLHLDLAIINECKTIMRENKVHWEQFGIRSGAESPSSPNDKVSHRADNAGGAHGKDKNDK